MKCPVCGECVHNKPNMKCSVCQTPHHTECWGYSGGCAIYGCKKSPKSIVAQTGTEIIISEYNTVQIISAGIMFYAIKFFKWITYPFFYLYNILDKFSDKLYFAINSIYECLADIIIGEFYLPSAQRNVLKTPAEKDDVYWVTFIFELFLSLAFLLVFVFVDSIMFSSPLLSVLELLVVNLFWYIMISLCLRKLASDLYNIPHAPCYMVPFVLVYMIIDLSCRGINKGCNALIEHGKQYLLETDGIRRKDAQQ